MSKKQLTKSVSTVLTVTAIPVNYGFSVTQLFTCILLVADGPPESLTVRVLPWSLNLILSP